MLVNNNHQSSNYVKNNSIVAQNNTSFGALKKVICVEYGTSNEVYCTSLGKNVVKELKDLAKVDRFFKENDVKASVGISFIGTEVKLESKPVAKNFLGKIKNFFTEPNVRRIRDTHSCPLDSAFFVAKKLREMKKLAVEQNL